MAAKKKAAKKTAKKSKKSAPKKAPKKTTSAARKSAPKKAPRKSSPKKKSWGTPAQKAALAKARRKRIANLKKHPRKKHQVKAFSYSRPAKTIHVPAHMSREEASRRARKAARTRRANEMAAEESRRRRGKRSHKRRYVYDNPLTGLELGAVIVTGVIGFTGADLVDRFIATRSGPFAGTAMATQQPLFSDWKRPAAGVGITVVPLVAAHFIKSPFWRSALQGIGVGAGLNVAGKAINALAGIALKDTTFGQRLYAPETKMHDAMVEVKAQEQKQKAGAAGAPTGAGQPSGLGTDIVAAGEAIRKNAPAMRALVEHQPVFDAVKQGRASSEQRAVFAEVNRQYANSFAELRRHAPETLDKAIKTYGAEQLGLAGVPATPKAAPAPAPLKKVDVPFIDVNKYAWAG